MFNYVATFHTPVMLMMMTMTMMMIMIIYSPIMMIMCSKIVHHRLVAMVIKSKVFSFLVFTNYFPSITLLTLIRHLTISYFPNTVIF